METEEFLKSKIASGSSFSQIFWGDEVFAWDDVTLTSDAKVKVEADERIIAVQKQRSVSGNSVTPTNVYTKHGLGSIKAVNDHRLEEDAARSSGNQGVATEDASLTRQSNFLTRRGTATYIALIKNDGDTKKADEFLTDRMVQGSDIYQIGPDEKILEYGNVTLKAEAKEEVANRESVDGIMEELPLVSLLTIPRTD